jgi:ribosomal protein S18 acetylase RimI-like enzyme
MSERVEMQRAIELLWERLFALVAGARFERRSDLIMVLCPPFPIPQFNGAWVVADTERAVQALPGLVAEVEAAGAQAWVQTRSGHRRVRQAALELGLTHVERLPGMVVRAPDFSAAGAEIEIGLIGEAQVHQANGVLAAAFGAPKALFDEFSEACSRVEGFRWYVGTVEGAVVSTAVGVVAEATTGIFNVATLPEQRGRGYGAALTSRAVTDGFADGSQLAFLQSSEIGHGVYRRLGFRDVEEYTLLTRPAAD